MKCFARQEMGVYGWFEKPDPICGSDDAICRPIAISPCTSDVHNVMGTDAPFLRGRVLGHEAVGEIVEVGKNVRDFKVGDRVIIPCSTPTWQHPDIQDTGHQDAGGQSSAICFSNYEDGTMAEKFKVRSADMNLCLLPEGMPLESAVMCTDMVTTGFHGCELANIKFGDTVVVFGIGPVGLMSVAGAKLSGAGKLIAIGTRPNCVALAKEYGATHIVSYKEGDVVKQIMEITHGRGADAVIVAGGDAETFNQALSVCKCGGTVANLNFITSFDDLRIGYMQSGMGFMGHRTLTGGSCPGGRRRMERLVEMVMAGRVDPSKMITHTYYGFDSILDAFEIMKRKPADLVKPIVIMD